MELTNLTDLLTDQLKDLYNAEGQLVEALPKMAKGASSADLCEAITTHLEETRGHVERLDRIGKALGVNLKGKKCKAMEGLVEEGSEVLKEGGEDFVVDLAIIAAAQRVEHYEISAYGTARTIAEYLGQEEVAQLLQETLDEESAADEKLTQVAEETYPEVEEGTEESASRGPSKRKR
jgi:ferritin-like metal-binding protein YciE